MVSFELFAVPTLVKDSPNGLNDVSTLLRFLVSRTDDDVTYTSKLPEIVR